MCCLQLTGEGREQKTLPPSEQDPWTSCHVSHTAPVPKSIHSLLPRPEVQVTSLFREPFIPGKGSSVYTTD